MIYTSSRPPIEPVDAPIHDYVMAGWAARGDRPALVDAASGRSVSYAELGGLVRGFAAGLVAEGFGKGDVVAIHAPNTLLYPVVFYGTTMIGATATTLSPLSTPDDMTKQLLDSDAKLVVTVSPLLPVATAAATQVAAAGGRSLEIVVMDQAEGHRSVLGMLGRGELPAVDIDPAEDVAVLPYSSGTTGTPKGVMLTHRNICTNLAQVESMHALGEDDQVIAILPMFHIYGLTVLMNGALQRGATVHVHSRFDLGDFLTSMSRDRITHAYVAPPVMLALAKHPAVDGHDLSHLKIIICAAAPLDGDLQTAVATRLGCEVGQAYGMTELSPGTHLHTDGAVEPPACVGQLFPSTEARLVSLETGEDAEPGAPGELWIRGPQVMKGYFGRQDATDAMIDGDGWLHTGDVATRDEDGNWFIVDRVKELIKYKGYQVAPAELEAMLLALPEVADAAVIGVLDEDQQEIPKAFVVAAPGADLTEESLMATIAGIAAPHKRIRRVEFLDAIPKAASGKILRRELRARERAAQGR